ncbi:MAG: TonB-dependent receptor [Pseudomonadota bacterium]|nr:TonB-dependent receptor [Pseudomonadota bacterium]
MVLVALLAAWLGTAAASNGDSEVPTALNISSGPLYDAIRQFSSQTDIQVTANFGESQAQDYPVAEMHEVLAPRAALDRILNGSGLSAKWHSSRTVRIFPKETVAPHAYDDVDEVLVTGSRIGGAEEGPAPVRVYSRADIDRFGVSSLPGLAGYFTQQPFSFGEWAQRSGAQHFQMRGLGVDTTLVLINGRRAPPSATSATLNAFDLNTIPLTAVDRIEVMSDSASAIYGADAIGGVVNVILKKGSVSPDVYLHYGAAAGGGEERRLAGSFGASGERFKWSFTADYLDRSMLVGAKRDIWRNQDYTRFGGTDYRVTTASPANVYSLTRESLPGLPTAQASVPRGSNGLGLTSQDFLPTAGVLSLDSSTKTWSILPDMNRISAFGYAELSLGRTVLFGELLVAGSDVVTQGEQPMLTGQIVPAENPYNPFGEAVAVDYALVGIQPVTLRSKTDFTRFVAGARSGLTEGWDWQLAITASDEQVGSTRRNDLDLSRVDEAVGSADLQTALNPFADGPAGSGALLSSLVADSQVLDYFSRGLQLSGFLHGQLFQLPGGTSEFVVGGEWRREEIKYFDLMTLLSERDVTSGFAEIKLPLLDSLSLKLAVRGDYYESADDSVNPQYGVVWRPTENWLLRAAYGTSFRPPSLIEQYSPKSEVSFAVADPRRGGTVSAIRIAFGGNADLENVTGHSFTGGVVYRPSRWPQLRLGAHYWRVVMDNRVVAPRFSDLAKVESALPSRVVRAAPTQDDRLAGWPGAVDSVDFSLLNYGRLETRGVDLDLSCRTEAEWGRLDSVLSATWVEKYSSEDIGSAEPLDRVGIANLQGTIPEWRLVGSLSLERGGWGISTTATFTPSYQDAIQPGMPTRSLPSRTLVDAQAWMDLDHVFEHGFLDGLKLTAGVQNLFDRNVDFANAGSILGYDISQADLKRRFLYFRITKAF